MQSQSRLLRCVVTTALLLSSVVAFSALGGCSPQNIGRYNETAFGSTKRVVNPILTSYDSWYEGRLRYWLQQDVEDYSDFAGPMPEDLKPPQGDYILGPGDLLHVTIQDLFTQGVPYVQDARITEEGNITLPYLRGVKATGFTARGLEQRLIDMLKVSLLKDPRVAIFVQEYRNRFYWVLEGVRTPGMYPLVTNDMNLLQGLSQTGGVLPDVQQKGFVVRTFNQDEFDALILQNWSAEEGAETAPSAGSATETKKTGPEAAGPPKAPLAAGEKEPALTPLQELQNLAEGKNVPEKPASPEAKEKPAAPEDKKSPSPEATQDKKPKAEVALPEGEITAPEPATPAAPGQGGWKFENGRWVQEKPAAIEGGQAPAEGPPAAVAKLPPTGTKNIHELPKSLQAKLKRLGVVQGGEGLKRIIRIDIPALRAFDPSQNIVLRNGDVVNLPEPPAGEWYIDGEVVRRGPYSLTGRKITLLQAVAAAGGLTPLAVPKRTELVRRISNNQEEIIYVDLAKIAAGEAPDFFLQPDDLIRVGTDQGAIFLAVLRNAFRATYGFGMVYDQNFADIYPWHGGVSPLFGGPGSSVNPIGTGL